MIIDTYVGELTKRCREWFPRGAVKTVARHPGRLTAEALRKHCTALPAIVFAPLRVSGVVESGWDVDLNVSCAAFVIAQDIVLNGRAVDKGTVASNLVERIVIQLHRASLDNAKTAEDVVAENLFDGPLDGRALTLWVVQWEARLTIPEEFDADASPFLHAHFEHDPPLTEWAVEMADHPDYDDPHGG